MYKPDLSVNKYWATHFEMPGQVVLYVGWLELGQPFPVGPTSSEFKARLKVFCSEIIAMTLGIHPCYFCNEFADDFDRTFVEGLGLGSCETLVCGKDNILYYIPDLIYHYIRDHNYLPPAEFIEAVLTSPLPASSEYRTRTTLAGRENDQEEDIYRHKLSLFLKDILSEDAILQLGNWIASFAANVNNDNIVTASALFTPLCWVDNKVVGFEGDVLQWCFATKNSGLSKLESESKTNLVEVTLFGVSNCAENFEPEEADCLLKVLGFVPVQAIQISSKISTPDDYFLLAKLALILAEHSASLINLHGQVLPPRTSLGPQEKYLRTISGDYYKIEYGDSFGDEQNSYHVVDANFMRNWLNHPDFHLV